MFFAKLKNRIRRCLVEPFEHRYISRTTRINKSAVPPARKSIFSPNVIRHQKYSLLKFIPAVLYEQFKHFFNMLFLVIVLLQFHPALRTGFALLPLSPLIFALTVTLSREAYDDYKRYKRDLEMNGQIYQRLSEDGLVDVKSCEIRVGDVLLLESGCRVPVDVAVLRVSDSSGSTFIRTDQLDGETDWKLRVASAYCQSLPANSSLMEHEISLFADQPEKDIYKFIGKLQIHKGEKLIEEPLGIENVVWMNSVLACGTMLGMVVYTGKDTRYVINSSKSPTKITTLDFELDRLCMVLCAMTVLISLGLLVMKGFHGPWYVYLLKFFFLETHIIPIGSIYPYCRLRVNLDVEKIVNSWFISNDKKMPGVIVRTTTIPEELARIHYMLTDKTGTLTKNGAVILNLEMEFRKIHIGITSFSSDQNETIRQKLEESLLSATPPPPLQETVLSSSFPTGVVLNVQTLGRSISARRRKANEGEKLKRSQSLRFSELPKRLFDAVFALCVCNSVKIVSEGYQSSSPDEIALVQWTEAVGIELLFRDRSEIRVNVLGSEKTFKVLQLFQFSSARKRMGIILKDEGGVITFFLKGADNIVGKLCCESDWLNEESIAMARDGLRTLAVASRIISTEEYESFARGFNSAQLALDSTRAAKIEAAIEQIERDFTLLALTGVEDELQDDVKSSLETLRNAGIKVWMLTGDKIETACCIAVSARLAGKGQEIYQVQHLTKQSEAVEQLEYIRSRPDICLAIDGQSLELMLQEHSAEFIQAASLLSLTFLFLRCSPTQKADVAQRIRKYTGKCVCCIGDGGNDVSMINSSNVGVGLVGKEGMQASLAADYSLTQFSHIVRLLLWHGRNSYKRTAKVAHLIIHRGFVMGFIQIVFSSIFYFAPIAVYPGMLSLGWGSFYTTLPTFSLLLDKDVTESIALHFPELFIDLSKAGLLFNSRYSFS